MVFEQKDTTGANLLVKTKQNRLRTNLWNHIVIVRQGKEAKDYHFYINGIKHFLNNTLPDSLQLLTDVDTALITPHIGDTSAAFIVGGATNSMLAHFDELRIYNRLISIDEAKDNYNNGCGNRLNNDFRLALHSSFNTIDSTSVDSLYILDLALNPAHAKLNGFSTTSPLAFHDSTGCGQQRYMSGYFDLKQAITLKQGSYTLYQRLRIPNHAIEQFNQLFESSATCLKDEATFINEAVDSLKHSFFVIAVPTVQVYVVIVIH